MGTRGALTPWPHQEGAVQSQKIPLAPAPETNPEAEKMQMLGRVAGGVAHDFANLLTLISGYSELVLNRIGSRDPLRAELEEIRQAANRGAGMTTRLLDFLRSQAAELQNLDLNALIRDVEHMLRPLIGEQIELVTRLAPDLPKVKADPARMTQVIMNLVLNARDAMPAGGRITIATTSMRMGPEEAAARSLAAGSYLAMSLADTGSGMDAGALSHLFEPLFTTKPGKGTGLGLSTVQGIVKESGGAIDVASTLGAGTTFTIYLPGATDVRESPAPRAVPRDRMCGTEVILLAEDEEGVRRLVQHVLESRGYTVLTARDGVEALEVYQQHQPIDLLLTDVIMPRMDGSQLADELLHRQPGVKVLFMSGYAGDKILHSVSLRPGVAFLQKPLKPDVLLAKVREVLDLASQSAAAS